MRKQRSGDNPGVAPTFATQPSRSALHDRQHCTGTGVWFWPDCRDLRNLGTTLDSFPRPGECAHARDCSRYSNRRSCVPGAPIQDHHVGWRGAGDPHRCFSGQSFGDRLCSRCRALGSVWLYRDECVGAGQCAHCTGSHPWHRPSFGSGLPGWRHHRHAGGGLGAAGGDRFLLVFGAGWCSDCGQAQSADRLCIRLVADFHFCAPWWRNFHQRR